jgi:hypothetical protein
MVGKLNMEIASSIVTVSCKKRKEKHRNKYTLIITVKAQSLAKCFCVLKLHKMKTSLVFISAIWQSVLKKIQHNICVYAGI